MRSSAEGDAIMLSSFLPVGSGFTVGLSRQRGRPPWPYPSSATNSTCSRPACAWHDSKVQRHLLSGGTPLAGSLHCP